MIGWLHSGIGGGDFSAEKGEGGGWGKSSGVKEAQRWRGMCKIMGSLCFACPVCLIFTGKGNDFFFFEDETVLLKIKTLQKLISCGNLERQTCRSDALSRWCLTRKLLTCASHVHVWFDPDSFKLNSMFYDTDQFISHMCVCVCVCVCICICMFVCAHVWERERSLRTPGRSWMVVTVLSCTVIRGDFVNQAYTPSLTP